MLFLIFYNITLIKKLLHSNTGGCENLMCNACCAALWSLNNYSLLKREPPISVPRRKHSSLQACVSAFPCKTEPFPARSPCKVTPGAKEEEVRVSLSIRPPRLHTPRFIYSAREVSRRLCCSARTQQTSP